MPNPDTIRQMDTVNSVLWLLIPLIILIWKTNLKGFITAAVAFWLLGILAGAVLHVLDPVRDGALIDSFWLVIGLPAGAVYAGILYGAVTLGKAVFAKVRR